MATRQRRDTFAPLKPEKLKPRIAQARAHFESKFAKVVSLRNLFSSSQLNSSPFIRTVVAAAAAAPYGNGTSSDSSSSLTPVVKLHITAAGQTATLRLVVDPAAAASVDHPTLVTAAAPASDPALVSESAQVSEAAPASEVAPEEDEEGKADEEQLSVAASGAALRDALPDDEDNCAPRASSADDEEDVALDKEPGDDGSAAATAPDGTDDSFANELPSPSEVPPEVPSEVPSEASSTPGASSESPSSVEALASAALADLPTNSVPADSAGAMRRRTLSRAFTAATRLVPPSALGDDDDDARNDDARAERAASVASTSGASASGASLSGASVAFALGEPLAEVSERRDSSSDSGRDSVRESISSTRLPATSLSELPTRRRADSSGFSEEIFREGFVLKEAGSPSSENSGRGHFGRLLDVRKHVLPRRRYAVLFADRLAYFGETSVKFSHKVRRVCSRDRPSPPLSHARPRRCLSRSIQALSRTSRMSS